MAAVKGRNEGKSMFLKEYLLDHPDSEKAAIDEAWREAGNQAAISSSLISKVRSDLGLTGKGRGKAKATATTRAAGSASTKTSRRQLTEGSPRQAAPRAAGGERTSVLVRLEGRIDDMLHEIRLADGLPEFEEALRAARRILVRSHGG